MVDARREARADSDGFLPTDASDGREEAEVRRFDSPSSPMPDSSGTYRGG